MGSSCHLDVALLLLGGQVGPAMAFVFMSQKLSQNASNNTRARSVF